MVVYNSDCLLACPSLNHNQKAFSSLLYVLQSSVLYSRDLRLQQQKGSPLPKPPSHPRVQRSDVDVSPKRNQTLEARQGWPWTTGILKPVTNAETRGWPFVQGSLVSSKPTRDSEKIGQQESSDRASSGWPFVGQQQNRSQGVNSGRTGWPFVASQP